MRRTRVIIAVALALLVGYVWGARRAADLRDVLVGESGTLFGWRVIDAGHAFGDTVVCRDPVARQRDRTLTCVARGE